MTLEESQNGKPRLVIERLELENFKSYAGVQHIGPFHKSFSAIVGPNGSGKSNVIDAMLFVFGKRAKQLRLNKVSELIHNSTSHQNLEAAKVSVYFEEIVDTGEETYDRVPNSQLTVSRTAQRNNASNYYLNGKKSNFTEVTDTLKAKGVDLNNNRFLILQGEVEQISLMKPKAEDKNDTGLLEYLEDIMGTDQYKQKIEVTGKRLEELNEERQSFVQRAKLAEREKDGLQDAKDLAEEYQKREIEALSNRSQICMHNMLQCEGNALTIVEQISTLKEKLAHEQKKLGRYDAELKTAEEAFKSQEKDCNKFAKKSDTMASKVKDLEREAVTLAEKGKHLKSKAKTAADAATKNSQKLKDLETQAATAKEEIPGLETTDAELHKDLEKSAAKLVKMQDSIKGELEAIHTRLSKARSDLAPWQDKMQACRATRELAATELALMKERRNKAANRLVTVREDLARAQEAVTTKQETIAAMKGEAKEQESAGDRAQKVHQTAVKEATNLEGQVQETRSALSTLQSSLQNEQSRGAVVKGLMHGQEHGDLEGVFGRLGDLAVIDKKYDAAVSNSAPALDNILVDTTTNAQHCVEYLRRNNLGVATFLILEKQAHLAAEANRPVQVPQGTARLFDLVKCQDPQITAALFYAFRNTLVSDDIDHASKIAYSDRNWGRVVTLKGDLISENGTMSGGGGQVKTGKMRLGNQAPKASSGKAAKAEMQQEEARLADLEAQLQASRDRVADSKRTIGNTQNRTKALALQLRKHSLDVESDVKKCQELQAQLLQLQSADSAAQGDDAEAGKMAELEAQVKAEEKKLQKVQADAAAVEAVAAGVQAELDNAGGEAMRQQKDLVATIKQDITDCEKNLARQRVLVQTAEKAQRKILAEVAKRKNDASASSAELEEIVSRTAEGAKLMAEMIEKRDVLLAELATARANVEAVQAEYDSRKADVGKIRAVEIQIQTTITERKELHEEEAAKSKEWQRKVATLVAQLKKQLPPGDTSEIIDKDKISAMTEDDRQQIEYRTTCLEAEMLEMQKTVDMGAIEAYVAKEADLTKRLEELATVSEQRNTIRAEHEDLRKRRLDDFMAGFMIISLKLKEMYQMITLGGDAELELVDSLDPFSEGIVFSVRPPKKSWKNIANLSGGEKTLSSLSLVFALHHFKPTPLYFMDEIDAALDFKNVSIVAHYVKERTKNAQFVVISLRNNMFELADHLVGIYKTDNCTKSVTINPNDFVVGAARPSQDPAAGRPMLQQQRVVT